MESVEHGNTMQEKPEVRMRIDGAEYLALPLGHRTTLVVGMLEMMDKMSVYLDPKYVPEFQSILSYSRSLTGAHLVDILDQHINRGTNKTYAIASNLFVALAERCNN